MHPVLQTLIWIGILGFGIACVCANLADAMAEDERRKGLADRDASALLRLARFAGFPVGRWMSILTVFTDWHAAYRSPLIRSLSLIARVGLVVGLLSPVTLVLIFLGLDDVLRG